MTVSLRVGVTLPTFTAEAGLALRGARAAEVSGLDGVFVFDHLWPMEAPGRPALWSYGVLAAIAAGTSSVRIGPLVARIGVFSDHDMLRMFKTLAAIVDADRLIAAVGSGDRLSAGENVAYGLAYASAPERLSALEGVLDHLRAMGVETWMGGRSPASLRVATQHADALNVWAATPDDVRRLSADGTRLTWAGQVLIGRDQRDVARLIDRYGLRASVPTGTVEEVATLLLDLGSAGAEWCVVAPLDYLHEPERSMETLCRVVEAVR